MFKYNYTNVILSLEKKKVGKKVTLAPSRIRTGDLLFANLMHAGKKVSNLAHSNKMLYTFHYGYNNKVMYTQ